MPENDNIISLPTPMSILADRIRAAYERTERGRHEWIEGTLELAAALAEARGRYHSDRQFSHWIVDAGLEDINHQDRAALICMAKDFAATRRVLEETKRVSWQHIWKEEMQDRFTQVSKQNDETKIIENPPLNPPIEPQAQIECAEKSPAPPSKPVKRNSPFYRLDRAGEVSAMYCSKTRVCLGAALNSKNKKEIWALILTAIDHGFLTPTESIIEKPHLRLLFPGATSKYASRFDLRDVAHRKIIRDEIMPIAIANRDAIIATPDQLEAIVAANIQQRQKVAQELAAQQKVAEALRAMPADQREVTMFGVRLWPRVEHQFGTYDYDQICAAIWYFRDLDGWVQGSISGRNPGSRAIIARLSTRWPQEYIDRAYPAETRGKIKKVYQLVHLLARLLEENPEGECIVPPTPKIEGQW